MFITPLYRTSPHRADCIYADDSIEPMILSEALDTLFPTDEVLLIEFKPSRVTNPDDEDHPYYETEFANSDDDFPF